jgi:hypothetical protein
VPYQVIVEIDLREVCASWEGYGYAFDAVLAEAEALRTSVGLHTSSNLIPPYLHLLEPFQP